MISSLAYLQHGIPLLASRHHLRPLHGLPLRAGRSSRTTAAAAEPRASGWRRVHRRGEPSGLRVPRIWGSRVQINVDGWMDGWLMRAWHEWLKLAALRPLQVKTQDGYILTMHRIPQGRGGGSAGKRQPVLLQHGVLMVRFLEQSACVAMHACTYSTLSSSSFFFWLLTHDGWMMAGRDDMASESTSTITGFRTCRQRIRCLDHTRQGHQVEPSPWVSRYIKPGWSSSLQCWLWSLEQVHHPVVVSQAYWAWSWDELASFDLPATVGFVFQQTGQKLHYVGHSMVGDFTYFNGQTCHSSFHFELLRMYVLLLTATTTTTTTDRRWMMLQGTLTALSAFSEGKLVDKIKSAALLTPVAYLTYMTTPIGRAAGSAFSGEVRTSSQHSLNFSVIKGGEEATSQYLLLIYLRSELCHSFLAFSCRCWEHLEWENLILKGT